MKKHATAIILGTVGLIGMLIAIYFFTRPKQTGGSSFWDGLVSVGVGAGLDYATGG
jgi:hypothetical protein